MNNTKESVEMSMKLGFREKRLYSISNRFRPAACFAGLCMLKAMIQQKRYWFCLTRFFLVSQTRQSISLIFLKEEKDWYYHQKCMVLKQLESRNISNYLPDMCKAIFQMGNQKKAVLEVQSMSKVSMVQCWRKIWKLWSHERHRNITALKGRGSIWKLWPSERHWTITAFKWCSSNHISSTWTYFQALLSSH